MCRDRRYRAILIDSTMPDVNSASLVRQLRLLQGKAIFGGMCLRSSPKATDESRELGCDLPILKPFDVGDLEELTDRICTTDEVVTSADNLLTLAPFRGRDPRVDGYFERASVMVLSSAENIASACFGEIILDLMRAPALPEKVVNMLIDVQHGIAEMGLGLRVVAQPRSRRALDSAWRRRACPCSSA